MKKPRRFLAMSQIKVDRKSFLCGRISLSWQNHFALLWFTECLLFVINEMTVCFVAVARTIAVAVLFTLLFLTLLIVHKFCLSVSAKEKTQTRSIQSAAAAVARAVSDLIRIKLIVNSNNCCWSLFLILSFSRSHRQQRCVYVYAIYWTSATHRMDAFATTTKMMSDYDEVRLLTYVTVHLCSCSVGMHTHQ